MHLPDPSISSLENDDAFISGDDLVAGLELSEGELAEASQWYAEEFHSDEGETIRTLRLAKGLSQSALAAMIDTKQSYISRLEKGKVTPYLETCRRLCVALGVDLNRLDAAIARQESGAHGEGMQRD